MLVHTPHWGRGGRGGQHWGRRKRWLWGSSKTTPEPPTTPSNVTEDLDEQEEDSDGDEEEQGYASQCMRTLRAAATAKLHLLYFCIIFFFV